MGQIKPEDNFVEEIKVDQYVRYACPFCKNELEYQIAESFDKMEFTFICQVCKKKFLITKI